MKAEMEITPLKSKHHIIKDKLFSPSEIHDLFNSKDIDKDWSFIEYKPRETSKLTHCYHRYPAKFIPQLVEKLMDEYLVGIRSPHVNDLFMGCGTTIVCAIKRKNYNYAS